MPPPASLRDLQRRFQAHLLASRDTGSHESGDGILESLVDAPPLPPAARLGIYANAYRVRLQEALRDTYPTLHQILGDETFADLTAGFVEKHPSVHRSIRWYGRELAVHLAGEEPYAGQPVLAELARFEWLLSEAFDAADAVPVDRSALQRIDPAAWAGLRFGFHPSLRRLDLTWNTVAVWQAVHREQDPPQPECAGAPVPWLLWRRGFKNYFRSLDPVEYAALDAALAGRAFGEICAVLGEQLPEAEVPLRAAMLIGTWTDDGLLTGLPGVPG